MGLIRRDLLLCAVAAQAYDLSDFPQDVDRLLDYGRECGPIISAGELQMGLQLCGLAATRIVDGSVIIPWSVERAIEHGHVVLAQCARVGYKAWVQWCILTDVAALYWEGIAMTHDWLSHKIGLASGYRLTGNYLVIEDRLPGWVDSSQHDATMPSLVVVPCGPDSAAPSGAER